MENDKFLALFPHLANNSFCLGREVIHFFHLKSPIGLIERNYKLLQYSRAQVSIPL
jgi:hypothetical protein